MAKQKFRITNWHTYNNALINRGSMTFWLDDEAIKSWYDTSPPSARGRPQRYYDLAITTVLVIKRVFRLTLRAAQGFIDSIFTLMGVPLRCPDYTCVSRRAKSVNVSFKTVTRGEIMHLVIDSTGLKCKHTRFSSTHFLRFPGFQPSAGILPASGYSGIHAGARSYIPSASALLFPLLHSVS